MVSQLKTAALKNRRIQDLVLHPMVWITMALIVGAFIGSQAIGPASQRFIKLGIVLAFFYVVLRYPMYISTGIYMVIYTLPTILFFGDSNTLLMFVLAVIWVIKYGMRIEESPRRTFLDWFIFAYLLVHLAGILHVDTTTELVKTFKSLTHLLFPILIFYIIVNAARSNKRLLFLTEMFTFSMVFVLFTAMMERYFPNIHYLPQWYLSFGGSDIFGEDPVHRAMGIFRTHGLLSDACGIMVVLQIFLMTTLRERRWLSLYHGLVGFASLVILMMTGNRGGIIVLAFGLLYMLWVFRRGITFTGFFSGAIVIVGVIVASELIIGREEGNITLLTRLSDTEFTNLIPDTRRTVWPYIWRHIMERPFTGHGPYFDVDYFRSVQDKIAWPHNSLLFYFVTLGIGGVIVYMAMILKLITKTRPGRGYDMRRISLAKGLAAIYHINVLQFMVGELRTDHQRPDVRVIFMWFLIGLLVLSYYMWLHERRSAPKVPIHGH